MSIQRALSESGRRMQSFTIPRRLGPPEQSDYAPDVEI